MEVLRHVWASGRATARDVQARVEAERPLAYTTVMSVMKDLADKGLLSLETEGTAYVYRAASRRWPWTEAGAACVRQSYVAAEARGVRRTSRAGLRQTLRT